MRKSPFSIARGNGRQHGFKWKSNEHRNSRGYVPYMNNQIDVDDSSHVNKNPNSSGDFIAFSIDTHSYHNQSPDESFFTSRGRRNRNFYRGSKLRNDNQGSNHLNNYSSPYGNNWRHSRGGHHRTYEQRMPKREVDISYYVDLNSFLEDPWKDLMTEQEKSRKNVNDISIESSACEIVNNSFDYSTIINENNYIEQSQDSSMNEKISVDSIQEFTDTLSQDNTDN